MLNPSVDSSKSLPAILYAALLSTFVVAAGALYSTTENPAGGCIPVVTAYAAGLALAFQCRNRPAWKPFSMGAGVIAALFLSQIQHRMLEEAQAGSQVAFIVAFLAVFLAFVCFTNDSALFLLVPSSSVLIAANTQTVDPSMVAYALGVCLFGAFALLCHAHLRGQSGSQKRPGSLQTWVLNLGTLGSLTFLMSAALALALMLPLHFVGSLVRPLVIGGREPWRSGKRVAGTKATPGLSGAFSSGSTVDVGQGPATVTHEPVLQVQSPERHYLLSRVYTEYDNHGWKEVAATEAPLRVPIPRGYEIGLDPKAARWPIVHQQITLLQPSDVVPAYARVKRVESDHAVDMAIDDYGCIRATAVPGRRTYEVDSAVPPDLDGLRPGGASPDDPAAPKPSFASARVSALASSLRGADEVTTSQNVVRYLQSHCTYDLNAPAVPSTNDAVDYFLFSSHAGYCDLFATSAAVLLQTAGVPARYCVGYAPGEWDRDHRVMIVTAAEAHAWVEVFVRGHGWILVDATPPGFSGPFSLQVALRGLLDRIRFRLPPLDFEHLSIGLSILGVLLLLYRLLPSTRRRRLFARYGDSALGQALFQYSLMERQLARCGVPRRYFETPDEFSNRLRSFGLPTSLMDSVREISRRFTEVRYGGSQSYEDAGPLLDMIRRGLREPSVRATLLKERSAPVEDVRRRPGQGNKGGRLRSSRVRHTEEPKTH